MVLRLRVQEWRKLAPRKSAGGMFADEARAKETKRRVWLPADDIITMITVQ